MMPEARFFIGYDERELLAYTVCARSLRATCSASITVEPLRIDRLRLSGLYRRRYDERDGTRFDWCDGRPFSTDFTFSRFLVPALCQWDGIAVFCDSDFLWRRDAADLIRSVDRSHAVQVVKHHHRPRERTKMRGQVQAPYTRKNWSSLIVWNCAHPANLALTPDAVNMREGRWLHGFGWLDDGQIGELPPEWNWLEGHDSASVDPAAVHFTRGTPDMPGYEGAAFADEWRSWAA